jgi:NTP pyrophosphatase (non-canonical NTP hydrolase)
MARIAAARQPDAALVVGDAPSDEELMRIYMQAASTKSDVHGMFPDHPSRTRGIRAVRQALAAQAPEWVAYALAERQRQNDKWGIQRHQWPTWMAILAEEVGEASEAALHTHFGGRKTIHDLREELVQTAAVAGQIVEHIDEVLAQTKGGAK